MKVGEEGKKVKTDDVFFEVSVGNYINGWSKTPDGTEPVGKEITVGDQDIDLYPLITGGHWLFFNGNENGGNLITKPLEPQFVKEGAKPSKVIPKERAMTLPVGMRIRTVQKHSILIKPFLKTKKSLQNGRQRHQAIRYEFGNNDVLMVSLCQIIMS